MIDAFKANRFCDLRNREICSGQKRFGLRDPQRDQILFGRKAEHRVKLFAEIGGAHVVHLRGPFDR